MPTVKTSVGEWYGRRKPQGTLTLRYLCVDKSTVSRTLALSLFHSTGSLKKDIPEGRALRKLTPPAQLLILQLCLSRPGIYLQKINDELSSVLEIQVSDSAICKFLQKSGFTYQRLKVTALQQDAYLRQQFISEVQCIHLKCLYIYWWTGTCRNLVCKYGYKTCIVM